MFQKFYINNRLRIRQIFKNKSLKYQDVQMVQNSVITIRNIHNILFIDVKAASKLTDTDLYGPICLKSLFNFNAKNHIYLILNNDGSKYLFIDSNKLFNHYKTDFCQLMCSNYRTTKIHDNEKPKNICLNKNQESKDLYYEDFISSKHITKVLNEIQYQYINN